MSPMAFANAFFSAGPVALVAKATTVLVMAALAALLLPRASAAVRHLIWLAALGGCAALAVFSPVAPRLVVPLPADEGLPVFVNYNVPAWPASLSDVVARGSATSGFATAPFRTPRAVAPSSRVRHASSAFGWMQAYGGAFGGAVWSVGCLLVLVRCVLGHVAIARIVRRASRVTSPEWKASLSAAMADVSARRTVRVLVSDELSAPVTTGFIHPIILLPRCADAWTDERRRVVLVHEVAHIARLDYAAQLVATAAGALFWFHPLAWLASTRLRAEAENAADDRVLAAGTTGIAYAGHLLELARLESGMPLTAAVAVGMVRASRLERRFRAMLDTTRSRTALSPRLQAAAASLTLAAMIPLAGARTTIVRPAHPQRNAASGTHGAPAVVAATTSSPSASAIAPLSVSRGTTLSPVDSTIDKTIDATSGDRLTLDLETGGSVIVHGWDQPRIRMRASLSGRDWRDTRVTLERSGNGVRLQSRFSQSANNQSTGHAFELWVPRHIDIDLSSAGGSLAINDLTGEFRGHTGGGGITIEGATGTATLTTGGGDVLVTNSSLGGSVSTGGGGVTISNVSGGLTGSSGSGPVIGEGYGGATTIGTGTGYGYGRATTVGAGASVGYGRATTVTSGATATINDGIATTHTTTRTTVGGATIDRLDAFTYSRAGGDIVLDDIPRGGRVSTGGGHVYVGSSGGYLSVSTGGGNVELAQMGGDATVFTGSGTVTITVVNTDGSEHSVDVTSGSGRVVLELPANLNATIELESAYTEHLGHKTTIDSDIALTQSETSTWDDREGTPRKFVRARGSVGNGRGVIRVRTVNGDIVLRRR